MKPIFKLLIIFFSMAIVMSCSEDDKDFPRATTLKVVNIINGIDRIIVKIGNNSTSYATLSEDTKISYRSFKNFYMEEGLSKEIVIVPENDTLNTIYSELLSLKGIHSLYLTGNSGEQEHLLIEDNPKRFTDSIVGIRFLNLSISSGSIDVGVTGSSSNVISGLDYKSFTEYMEFPARAADGSYRFEFKDMSGNVLISVIVDPLDVAHINNFNRDVSSKKNLTLVLTESPIPIGTGVVYRVTRVNNY